MAFSIEEYFSINIFFIIFRETLECVIIVSVLLAYLEQNFQVVGREGNNRSSVLSETTLYRKLRFQVWFGALCGILLCLLIGGLFILSFYLIEVDLWSKSEHYWESVFSILAAVIISIMGFGMLQMNKLEKKWHIKLGHVFGLASKTQADVEAEERYQLQSAGEYSSLFSRIKGKTRQLRRKFNKFTAKHTLFILPFITTLRECLESILFIGGIGVTESAKTYGLSIFFGLAVGASIGIFLYRSGTSSVSAQKFLVYSTSLLYIISAGLLSKGIWQFELQRFIDKCGGLDVSEVGSGPGSYDVNNIIWHVDCCNGEVDGPWMIFTAIFGWTNSATYGSVFSYIIYWIVIAAVFKALKFENKHGYFPLIPYRWQLKKIKKNYAFLVNLKKDQASHQQKVDSPRLSQDSETRLLSNN